MGGVSFDAASMGRISRCRISDSWSCPLLGAALAVLTSIACWNWVLVQCKSSTNVVYGYHIAAPGDDQLDLVPGRLDLFGLVTMKTAKQLSDLSILEKLTRLSEKLIAA